MTAINQANTAHYIARNEADQLETIVLSNDKIPLFYFPVLLIQHIEEQIFRRDLLESKGSC